MCITLETGGNHICPTSEVSYPLIMANVFFQDTACDAIPFQRLSATMLQSSPDHGTPRVELKTDLSHIFLLFGSFPTQENYIKSFFSPQTLGRPPLCSADWVQSLDWRVLPTRMWKHSRGLKGDTAC